MYGGETSRGATAAMVLDSWPEASLSLVLSPSAQGKI